MNVILAHVKMVAHAIMKRICLLVYVPLDGHLLFVILILMSVQWTLIIVTCMPTARTLMGHLIVHANMATQAMAHHVNCCLHRTLCLM